MSLLAVSKGICSIVEGWLSDAACIRMEVIWGLLTATNVLPVLRT